MDELNEYGKEGWKVISETKHGCDRDGFPYLRYLMVRVYYLNDDIKRYEYKTVTMQN